jgi:hypothetical protein
VGAALSGLTLGCGENVCGTDPGLELNGRGKIVLAPEIDRRIETYKRYHRGFGEILVQMNAEDARLGVAEYVIEKHGLEAIELKWGELAGIGESRVLSLERALEWKRRGAIVTPNPSDPVIQAGLSVRRDQGIRPPQPPRVFGRRGIRGRVLTAARTGIPADHRQSRSLRSGRTGVGTEVVQQGEDRPVDDRRCGRRHEWEPLGQRRTAGGYWRSICTRRRPRSPIGWRPRGSGWPTWQWRGGFRAEDDLFKCLALGGPHVKAACVDCAPMIPDMAGESTGGWVEGGNPTRPAAEETSAGWEQVVELVGREEMLRIPPGAVGIYSRIQMLRGGLQRRMAGAGCFHVAAITRERLVSLTRQCADVTGIPLALDDCREEAEAVVDG